MNERSNLNLPTFSIAAVERDIGIAKDTLRVWEKRYGFPNPHRDEFGERLYPMDQVERLRVIKRLLDSGRRPGKVIGLSDEELHTMASTLSAGEPLQIPAGGLDELKGYLDLIKERQSEEFKQVMSRLLLSKGLRGFVVDVVAPMNVMVGEAWSRGYFEIFEEHLYTETIQVVLRNAISTMDVSTKKPKVLLTTLPNELHGLGLLMAQCVFAMEGAQCVSLGTQTPVYDIVRAVEGHKIDIVALSFSAVQSAPSVSEAILDLRDKLPSDVEIWCGGSSSALRRRGASGFQLLATLDSIPPALKEWRENANKLA